MLQWYSLTSSCLDSNCTRWLIIPVFIAKTEHWPCVVNDSSVSCWLPAYLSCGSTFTVYTLMHRVWWLFIQLGLPCLPYVNIFCVLTMLLTTQLHVLFLITSLVTHHLMQSECVYTTSVIQYIGAVCVCLCGAVYIVCIIITTCLSMCMYTGTLGNQECVFILLVVAWQLTTLHYQLWLYHAVTSYWK